MDAILNLPRKSLVFIGLVCGLSFVCGLIIGLPVLGWWIWPVQWTDIPQTPLATYTPYPTYTPFPTLTPSPQPTSTPVLPTTTPSPDAIVLASIDVLDGPGFGFSLAGQLGQGETPRVVGQYDDCQWLKIVAESNVQGWISGDPSVVGLRIPCASIADGTFRPHTGNLKTPEGAGGGEIVIENGSRRDGVVVVVDRTSPDVVIAAAYVRAGETFNMAGIPDGVYFVFFASGSEWDGNNQRFTSERQAKRFEEEFDFISTTESATVWKISLQPVIGGQGRTEAVPDDEFPVIDP